MPRRVEVEVIEVIEVIDEFLTAASWIEACDSSDAVAGLPTLGTDVTGPNGHFSAWLEVVRRHLGELVEYRVEGVAAPPSSSASAGRGR